MPAYFLSFSTGEPQVEIFAEYLELVFGKLSSSRGLHPLSNPAKASMTLSSRRSKRARLELSAWTDFGPM
jgi:hypothetical protein